MIQAVLLVVHLTSPPQLGFEIASSLGFGNPLVTSLYLSLLIKKKRFIFTYVWICMDLYMCLQCSQRPERSWSHRQL